MNLKLFFTILPLLIPTVSLASDCGPCAELVRQTEANLVLKTRTEDILRKNKEYVIKLDKSETSKRIKVNSNILITTLQIETIQNRLVAIQKNSESKGCHQCVQK